MNVIVFMYIFFKVCEFEMMSGWEYWINFFYICKFMLYFVIDSEKYREVLIFCFFYVENFNFFISEYFLSF